MMSSGTDAMTPSPAVGRLTNWYSTSNRMSRPDEVLQCDHRALGRLDHAADAKHAAGAQVDGSAPSSAVETADSCAAS